MADVKKLSWNSIESEKLSETLSRKFVHGDRVMVAEIRLKKGAVVPEHHHESEQLTWVLNGELVFEIGGKKISVKSGEVLVIPSNVPHKATSPVDTLEMDIFSPIRMDWINKEDDYLRGKQA
ncbi:MAG TPA: cupin domain-containing protein [Thermoplasmataceae archaeon]|nr:cupin domain-containing protein [Thermoplasmataceae archaeon]